MVWKFMFTQNSVFKFLQLTVFSAYAYACYFVEHALKELFRVIR